MTGACESSKRSHAVKKLTVYCGVVSLTTALLFTLTTVGCGKSQEPEKAASSESNLAKKPVEQSSESKEFKQLGLLADTLPNAVEVAPWVTAEDTKLYVGEDLFNYIDGGAEIFLEYGFDSVATQEYHNGEAKDILIDLYKMKDPTAAFGIYSFNRARQSPELDIGTEGSDNGQNVAFWRGVYYASLTMFSSDAETKAHLLKMARTIADKMGAKDEWPPIMKLLPTSGLTARSSVLLRGPIGLANLSPFPSMGFMEFTGDSQCVLADYKLGDGTAKAFLAQFAAQDKAAAAFDNFRAGLEGQESSSDGSQRFRGADTQGKHYYATRSADCLFILRTESDEAQIASLREEFLKR